MDQQEIAAHERTYRSAHAVARAALRDSPLLGVPTTSLGNMEAWGVMLPAITESGRRHQHFAAWLLDKNIAVALANGDVLIRPPADTPLRQFIYLTHLFNELNKQGLIPLVGPFLQLDTVEERL
jgi:hypothetical protein